VKKTSDIGPHLLKLLKKRKCHVFHGSVLLAPFLSLPKFTAWAIFTVMPLTLRYERVKRTARK